MQCTEEEKKKIVIAPPAHLRPMLQFVFCNSFCVEKKKHLQFLTHTNCIIGIIFFLSQDFSFIYYLFFLCLCNFWLICLTVRPRPPPPPPPPVPGAPPEDVRVYPDSSTSLRVEWSPPPKAERNGRITYYKIFHVLSSRPDSDAAVVEVRASASLPSSSLSSPTSSSSSSSSSPPTEFVLDELREWAEYRVWVLAGTSVGDGPRSQPVAAKTDESGA